MSNLIKLATALSLITMISCSNGKPDQITTIKPPVDCVFYTVETYHGHGALDDDYKSVYLHMERSHKSVKALVLSGEYISVSKIEWANQAKNTIYFDDGFTDTFRNQVTLSIDGASENFHVYLQEIPSKFKAH